VQPVLSAIQDGATDAQAMLAAGLTSRDRLQWEKLALEGHRVWEQVIRELRVARYNSTYQPTKRRKAIAESDHSTMRDTEAYLERLLPDDYGPIAAEAGPVGGGRVVINLVTSFEPPAPLPAGAVIDVAALPAGEDDA
jgi:hypothetical protein